MVFIFHVSELFMNSYEYVTFFLILDTILFCDVGYIFQTEYFIFRIGKIKTSCPDNDQTQYFIFLIEIIFSLSQDLCLSNSTLNISLLERQRLGGVGVTCSDDGL